MEESTMISNMSDLQYLPLADELLSENDIYGNPYIYSPEAPYELPFYQTLDTLVDVERYKAFLDNAIYRFRRSRAYKGYKAYLMSMGLNRCQILGNITSDMAEIEMHHNFLTIFDISILISQHVLNTVGFLSTFDLVQLLTIEHRNNKIPIVMLSKTVHQVFHNNQDFYIPANMTFGKWWELLYDYRYGITLDIAYKVIRYIDKCEKNSDISNIEAFKLREQMKGWANYNEYGYTSNMCGSFNGDFNNGGNDNNFNYHPNKQIQ